MDWATNVFYFWTEIRPFIGSAFCMLGGGLAIIGAVGMLRFPDFYSRLHAASITDTGAVLLILTGMALLSPDWLVLVKLLAIAIFLFLTGPTSSHAIANAAHTAGLQPFIGRFGENEDPEDNI